MLETCCTLVVLIITKGMCMLYKLESLRGIAAILVVFFHIEWGGNKELLSFVHNSWLFVDFFFVLSGFVIAYAYLEKIQNGMKLPHYFLLRVARVYPLHFVVMLFWLPYIGAKFYLYSNGFGGVDPSITENTQSFFVTLLLVNSVGLLDYSGWNVASWSVSAEIFAYLFFFVSVFLLKRFNLKWFALLSCISVYCLLHSFEGSNIALINKWAFLRGIAGFCFGWYIYYLYSHARFLPAHLKYHELLSVVLIVLSVSLVSFSTYFSYVAIFVFGYSVLIFAQKESSLFGKLLETAGAKALGRWSYSIYMTHMLILSGVSDVLEHIVKLNLHDMSWVACVVLDVAVFAIIIFVSSLTYRWIEVPARNYSKVKLDKLYVTSNVK